MHYGSNVARAAPCLQVFFKYLGVLRYNLVCVCCVQAITKNSAHPFCIRQYATFQVNCLQGAIMPYIGTVFLCAAAIIQKFSVCFLESGSQDHCQSALLVHRAFADHCSAGSNNPRTMSIHAWHARPLLQ